MTPKTRTNSRAARSALFALAAPTFIGGILALDARTIPAQAPPDPRIPQLGKALFFEKNLSNPGGLACATCHDPLAGFTYSVSAVNEETGEVPGAVTGRYGNRKPLSVAYARFIPTGTPHFDSNAHSYVGGLFWDGRAPDLPTQAEGPLQNPNEMNNLVHNLGSPALVVTEVETGPNSSLFRAVYGQNVFQQPTAQVLQLIVRSIAAWESSREVSPFSSKYDAYVAGVATLTPTEMEGLRLFTGATNGRPGGPAYQFNAQCSLCHTLAPSRGTGLDLFTNSHYFNTGIPRNPNNPYYRQTNPSTDPVGYNPYAFGYIDFGLGDFLYPDNGFVQGDPLSIKGVFKTPTLRNVDQRPYPDFVKDYGHNGFFKSLAQIVHFYNTRNLTTVPGEVIDFTKPNPYADLKGKPLWPAPEVPSPLTLVNPKGLRTGPGPHLGNLGLTPQQESDLVAFLRTLSDGYFSPR